MAIGWLSVLKMVSWGDLISNAPRIADGARQLWDAVARGQVAADHSLNRVQSSLSSDSQSIARLQAQLATALVEVTDLHTQMLECTELIQALAEQNTQLIKRVELNRIRLFWLTGFVMALGIVSVVGLIFALTS